jgi:beta-N-acetylhexosaminidase
VTDDAIRRQVGQCLMVGIPQPTLDAASAELLRSEAIGNVVLFARNTPEPVSTAALTQALQALARRHLGTPMLISCDQEGGSVLRLTEQASPIPSAMAIGATGSLEDADTAATVTAQELRAVGVNMNLAPVLDVNSNPNNPVIGTRSLGEDPQRVAALGRAIIAAYRRQGVASCAKHFPGHGDTAVDSHLALPVIGHTRPRLDAVELVPFRAAVAQGVEAVMVGHLAISALDASGCPASMSPAVIEGLLRTELGYQGVVCTDCIEMAGASAQVETAEAAVRAFVAGADLILISHTPEQQRAGARALREACALGRISGERLRRSVEKIARLKRWLAGMPAPPLDVVGSAEHRAQIDRLAQRAVTLTRNHGILPLRPRTRVGVVAFQAGAYPSVESQPGRDPFLQAAQARGLQSTRAMPLEPARDVMAALQAWAARYEALLVGTRRADHHPSQVEATRGLARVCPTVVIALREPYDLGLIPEARAALATYGDSEPLSRAALAVCFGEAPATGQLPVSISGPGTSAI